MFLEREISDVQRKFSTCSTIAPRILMPDAPSHGGIADMIATVEDALAGSHDMRVLGV